MDCNETLRIPRELQGNDYHLNLVAADLAKDNSEEAKPYINTIKAITQGFFDGNIDTYTALKQIRHELTYYDYNVLIPREEQEQRERIYIDNPYDLTEIAIKTNIHKHDIFKNGLFGLIEAIGLDNLGLTDYNGNVLTDTKQIKGGNQRKRAEQHLKQYMEYRRRPDIKRYALEVTDIFDEPIITIFLGQGQAYSGYYLNRLSPIVAELFLTMKENETVVTTYPKFAEMIKLVNHNYNVYSNIDYNRDSDYLIEQAQKHNECFNSYQFRQFYKNAYRAINKIVRELLYKLDKSYSAIRLKENYLISAKDKNENIYNFTSKDSDIDMIKHAQAAILQEMNISTIGAVFLKKKAPQFFSKVIDYINREYGEQWTHYKSQIEIKIISLSQLQKCYDEYIVKHQDTAVSLQECRDRIKYRLSNAVDRDISRAEQKYIATRNSIKEEFQKGFESQEFQDLVDSGVFTEKDLEQKAGSLTKSEIRKTNVFTGYAPDYKDIQAEIMKFLIDSAESTNN